MVSAVMKAETLAELLKKHRSSAKSGTEVAEKITRATFVYMPPRPPEKGAPVSTEEEFAQCETCIHFLGKVYGDNCEWMSPVEDVDEDDSCCFYAPGKAKEGAVPLSISSKEEMGFVSRKVRCENCCFFDPDTEPREHCDFYTQLNLILPGLFDLDRYVEHLGCCNAQTPGYRNPKVFGPFGPIKHGDDE